MFLPNMVLSRLLNEPPTLAFMSDYREFWEEWLPGVLGDRLKAWRDKGNRVFNPAYIVTTCGKKMDKVDYILQVAGDVNKLRRPQFGDSLQSYWYCLTTVDGLGAGFLAAQVIADLKYTPLLRSALDWEDWCVPGPGSIRGLNRLLGNGPDAKGWNGQEFRSHVQQIQKYVVNNLKMHLHAQDLQNCLCEFDKYMRAKGGGRPKQNYP
jgi:hypothetical protein